MLSGYGTVRQQRSWGKQTLLAKPTQPKICRYCGDPVIFIASEKDASKQYPANIIWIKDSPGKAVPVFGENHLPMCKGVDKHIADVQKFEVSTVEETIKIEVTYKQREENFRLVVFGQGQTDAMLKMKAKLAAIGKHEILSWKSSTLA